LATPEGAERVTTSGKCGSKDVAEVVLGVDTHLDFHVAMVLDHLGRRLGQSKVPTTLGDYRNLLRWAVRFGPVRCGVGLEGTGSYCAGLVCHLKAVGISVVEVERPKRRHLKRNGKSDTKDAEAPARAGLAGVPKSSDGKVEMARSMT
jgi:transposase